MKTIAICDDDMTQLSVSAQVLWRFSEDAGLELKISLYQDAAECVEAAAAFDIVFMDIEFENGPLGIDAVVRINETAPSCQVVYLTNYLHYSLDVYRTDHVWYVLKSQLEQRLPEIFQKLALVDEARRASIVITTKDEGAVVNIPCSTICYLERRERVTSIFTQAEKYVVRDKLPDLLERLPQNTFARCHNSYAVYLPRVKEIHSSDLLLDDDRHVLVSRSYSKRFRERYLLWADAWTV